jgi:hypothetical protein
MAAQFPTFSSQWQFIGARWFPVLTRAASAPPVFLFTVPTLFKFGDKIIDAAKDGLEDHALKALETKFPGLVGQPTPEESVSPSVPVRTLPLVPQGTVIDITPGS